MSDRIQDEAQPKITAMLLSISGYLYLPDFFTSSYVSFPSIVNVMSSAGRYAMRGSVANNSDQPVCDVIAVLHVTLFQQHVAF